MNISGIQVKKKQINLQDQGKELDEHLRDSGKEVNEYLWINVKK